MCERERERERVCVCVCERERERERERLTKFTRVPLTLPISPILQQEYIEPTMAIQSLSVVQPVSNIPRVAMEIEHSGGMSDGCRGLLDKIPDNSTPVFRREANVLISETQRAGSLYKDSGTLGLLRVVQQGVLVVIEPANHRDDEQDQDDDPAVHPVDQDEDEDGRTADPPELPEEKGEEATQRFCRAESHVPVRRENRCWHS